MDWRERLREIGEQLASGELTTSEYRALSDEILAAADRESAARTAPTSTEDAERQSKLHIPVSAAWEAPSGEMTQIVGTHDSTTVVPQKDKKGDTAG